MCCCSASWVLLEFFLLTLQGPAPNTLHYGRPFILISRGEWERGKHGAISGQSQRVSVSHFSVWSSRYWNSIRHCFHGCSGHWFTVIRLIRDWGITRKQTVSTWWKEDTLPELGTLVAVVQGHSCSHTPGQRTVDIFGSVFYSGWTLIKPRTWLFPLFNKTRSQRGFTQTSWFSGS